MADDRSAPSSHGAPPIVLGAVATGTVSTPFLAVYAGLFVLRGLFVKTDTPDVFDSHGLEALAGLGIAAFLVLTIVGLTRFVGGRAPWLFVITQLAVLVASGWLLLDRTSGDPQLPALLLGGSVVALVLGALPPSLRWTGVLESKEADADELAGPAGTTTEDGKGEPVFGEVGWEDSYDADSADQPS
ncbi:MAG: hypothetical protein ACR2KJ_18420 [Jatrophihabitans sp.]